MKISRTVTIEGTQEEAIHELRVRSRVQTKVFFLPGDIVDLSSARLMDGRRRDPLDFFTTDTATGRPKDSEMPALAIALRVDQHDSTMLCGFFNADGEYKQEWFRAQKARLVERVNPDDYQPLIEEVEASEDDDSSDDFGGGEDASTSVYRPARPGPWGSATRVQEAADRAEAAATARRRGEAA